MNQATAIDLKEVMGTPLLHEVPDGTRSTEWVEAHAAELESTIARRGAVLIRGLRIPSTIHFSNFLVRVFGEELQPYTFRSTPRTGLRGNVYTASEYHSDQTIMQHNENAYASVWPMRIGFMCMVSPSRGGQTPIADTRSITAQILPEIRDEFRAKGIQYVRNYSGMDLPWTEVFGTSDTTAVESFCERNGIKFEWLEDGSLRTKQALPAIRTHPSTGEELWFNQAHLFHHSNLDPDIAETLIRSLGEDRLPRNACFGDGSELDPEMMSIIRDCYVRNKIMFQWERGDLLLLDNMLYTHGREPFSGDRKVLVGMARPGSG